MTRTEEVFAPDPMVAVKAAALPLVSVIIVNYNHSALLPQTVESVMAQTYPSIECLIVDDASTDDSREVIAAIQRHHPSVRALCREINAGALRASLDGFAATRGTLVHFLDADDLILPTFIEAHVGAHLSLRAAVGFTSCDVILTTGDTAVSCCDNNIARYRSHPDGSPAPRRPLPPHLAEHLRAAEHLDVLVVAPWHTDWAWAPTSSVVYKRNAVQFLAGIENTERIRSSSDTLFCQGINAITGSAVIDAPLAIYRHHGTNDFLRSTPLDHVIGFDKVKLRAKIVATLDVLIEHVLSQRHAFAARYWSSDALLDLLRRYCHLHPDRPSPGRLVADNIEILGEVIDKDVLRRWVNDAFRTEARNATPSVFRRLVKSIEALGSRKTRV